MACHSIAIELGDTAESETMVVFGWAVAMIKVDVGCELSAVRKA